MKERRGGQEQAFWVKRVRSLFARLGKLAWAWRVATRRRSCVLPVKLSSEQSRDRRSGRHELPRIPMPSHAQYRRSGCDLSHRCSLADALVATAAKRWFVPRDASTVWRLWLRLPIRFREFPGFERTNETAPLQTMLAISFGDVQRHRLSGAKPLISSMMNVARLSSHNVATFA